MTFWLFWLFWAQAAFWTVACLGLLGSAKGLFAAAGTVLLLNLAALAGTLCYFLVPVDRLWPPAKSTPGFATGSTLQLDDRSRAA